MPLTLTLTRLGPSAPQFPPVTCLSPPAPASVRAFVTPAYAGYVPKLPVATKTTFFFFLMGEGGVHRSEL